MVPGQVAEIIVTVDGGLGRRGSGYRVGPSVVLTAAHVVEDAVAVRVRFDADLPGEWTNRGALALGRSARRPGGADHRTAGGGARGGGGAVRPDRW